MRARLVLVALAALSTACKDSNQPPTTGALRVSVATTGIDVDPIGYRVTLDLFSPDSMSGGAPVGLNGSVTITLLLPGSHTVGLGRVPSNCGVGGSNPRSVKISAGDTVTVAFTIVCRAAFGSIAVAAVTSGTHLDPDGYFIEVDGIPRTLAINETTVFDGVRAGPHSVSLDGVATNCSVAGDNPRTVMSIAGGDARDTVRTTFQVSCVGSGSVRATTTTTGADLDPDGYSVRLQKPPLDTATPIPVNGTVTVSGLPVGTYSVTLVDVAPNCTLSGANPRTVTVVEDATTDVTYAISCAALGSVQVTVTTTGVDLDPDGYVVGASGAAGGGSGPVAANGAVTISRLVAGNYQVTLVGEAANCDLTSANPVTVTVPSGGTAAVSFAAACTAARQLAFSTSLGANDEIYVIKENGTATTRLTMNPASDREPAWSPDGTRVAFSTNRDGNYEIYVMNADGSNPVQLTHSAAADAKPTWSPDGSKIAFTSDRDGNPEIYVMSADGSNPVRLTNNTVGDGEAAWSPGGGKIAFYSERDGNPDIYVMNSDGSGVTRLTTAPGRKSGPAWSPDGTKIVFASGDCDPYYGCYSDLYVMNADGSGVTQLVPGSGASLTGPAWSPDGRWIAFAYAYCDYYYGCSYNLQVIRPDGKRQMEVTSGSVASPTWRP